MIYLTRENPNFQKPQFTYFFLIDACIGEPKKPTCSPRFFVKPNQIRRGVYSFVMVAAIFLLAKWIFWGHLRNCQQRVTNLLLVLENQPKLV